MGTQVEQRSQTGNIMIGDTNMIAQMATKVNKFLWKEVIFVCLHNGQPS